VCVVCVRVCVRVCVCVCMCVSCLGARRRESASPRLAKPVGVEMSGMWECVDGVSPDADTADQGL
jgi:hypothetical protein